MPTKKQLTPSEVARYKKRVYNKDGSISTERSMTVNVEGRKGTKYINIPTIVKGKQLSPKDAIKAAKKSGVTFKKFKSIPVAVSAAKKRSNDIGKAVRSYDAIKKPSKNKNIKRSS